MNTKTVSRNDPCPCGSGKKYKQCCQHNDAANSPAAKNRLLESVPDLFNQGLKYQFADQPAKAEEIYQLILTINPKHADTLANFGLLMLKQERLELAVDMLRKAARAEPSAKNFCNLATVLPTEEGIEYLLKALILNPANALCYKNLGSLVSRVHRYKEAIVYFHKTLEFIPKDHEVYSNIGHCLMMQSQYREAASYFRQAIALNPQATLPYTQLLFCLCFDTHAFPETYLKDAKSLDKLWQSVSIPYTQWLCSPPSSTQPLRVGLVSGDFGNHPVGFFLETVISQLNNTQIELFAYSTRAETSYDELTKRIQPYFNKWHNIRLLSDQQASAQIHDDGIHILIDLAGYTADSRLSLFAWRPAPIQVSWLGFFASTGLSFMDFFIADPMSVPKKNQSHFTEKVWYLPETRLCFSPPASDIAQDLSTLPALKNGFTTFGCFQSLSKLNDTMLKHWATILGNCPNSKLLIKNNQIANLSVKAELLERLNTLGIKTESLILEEGSPRAQYLGAYSKVDFMLDTFPYPGGTTTCEALWMGVPTLTLAGNTLLERQGAAMLNCVGLNDWIANNEEEYIQKATSFAHSIQHLSQLRSTIRGKMAISPLVDANLFARNLNAAFNSMWQEKMQQKTDT